MINNLFLKNSLVLTAGLVLVFFIGYMDHISESSVDVSVLYMIPVALTVWFSDRKYAFTVSFIAVAVWEFEEVFFKLDSEFTALVWANIILRLAYFLLAVIVLSKLKGEYDKEKKLADTDSLTGALNRRSFSVLIQKALAENKKKSMPYSIIYFDIDNFKMLNDSRGHAFGDLVLKNTADIIKKRLSEKGFLSRLGGDEFAVFLMGSGPAEALKTINGIKGDLAAEEHALKGVTYSFGVLTVQKKIILNTEELIRLADKLMYSVKKTGKNAFKLKKI